MILRVDSLRAEGLGWGGVSGFAGGAGGRRVVSVEEAQGGRMVEIATSAKRLLAMTVGLVGVEEAQGGR